MEFNTQIAEFTFPFPAKIFEEALNKENIKFKIFDKNSYEGGMESSIFYIKAIDFEKAIIIKEKVNKENAELEIQHIHPVKKIIGYLSLVFFIGYLIYKLINFL